MSRSKAKPISSAKKLTYANPTKTLVREYFGGYQSKVNGPMIGVEVEIESENDRYRGERTVAAESKYWKRVRDGSLRDSTGQNQGGCEFVYKLPTLIGEARESFLELDRLLSEGRTKVRRSNRTSVHVHYNVQDLTLSQLTTFFCLYYTVEPILSRFNGFEREHNLFCLQATKSTELITNLLHALEHRRADVATKYSALNYMPVMEGGFGTVEFRAGAGIEKSAMEILPWIELIEELMTVSRKFGTPLDILSALSSEGTSTFIAGILPKIYKEGTRLFSKSELEDCLEVAMRNSQCLAYDIDWGSYEPKGQTPEKKQKAVFETRW